MIYFVVKDKNTGLYFRGKGVNKWGKYFNQASIYRIKAMAENAVEEENRRGADCEVVPIQITETDQPVQITTFGKWTKKYKSGNAVSEGWVSSCCDMWHKSHTDFCPYCGAVME
jgi:hypothetical protein